MPNVLDNLSREKRKKLVAALKSCIQKTGTCLPQPRLWKIPHRTVGEATLRTYGLPVRAPRIWFAMTSFEGTEKRNAFLISCSIAESQVTTAFEFNVGVKPSNRINIRLEDEGNGNVIVRCMCSFAFNGGVRHSAEPFYEHVRREKLPLKLEKHGKSTFVRLFDFSLDDVESEWPRIWKRLAAFAKFVSEFKKAMTP